MDSVKGALDLTGREAIITGGTGFLGMIAPGGTYAGQENEFAQRLSNLILLDVTSANVIIDGSRTTW